MNKTLALVFAGLLAVGDVHADISQARTLLDSGQPEQAYRMLIAQEAEKAGDPEYDYLLGLAAARSGHASEAAFALERVLLVRPQHMGALFDLGLLYLQAGDTQRAREAFRKVAEHNPPPLVREIIRTQLAATQQQDTRRSSRSWVELSGGYDSNINNSTDRNSVYVPLLGASFNLNANNVSQSDTFARIAAGTEWDYRYQGDRFVRASAQGHKLLPQSATAFGTHGVDGSLSFGRQDANRRWELGVSGSRRWLDNAAHSKQLALFGGWRDSSDARRLWDYFGRITRIRNDGALSVEDADQYLAGARLVLIPGSGDKVYAISAFGGYENAINGRADGNNRLAGVRLGTEQRLAPKVTGYGTVGLTLDRYDSQNVSFLTTRRDRQLSGQLGVKWQAAPGWLVGGELQLVRNRSNIAINDYQRVVTNISLRREF